MTMHKLIGSFALTLFVLIGTGTPLAQTNQKPLDQSCQKQLTQKLATSPIKRRLYHISKMQGACRQILLKDIPIAPSKAQRAQTTDKQKLYSPKNLSSKYASWGVDPIFKDAWINLLDAWKAFQGKREVVVAVIDTGIDPKHPYLRNNIRVVEGVKGIFNYGKDFSVRNGPHSERNPSGQAPIDNHGHGTHVAGILKTVFPEVKILPIKYYNPTRSGQENLNSLIRSLKYAIDMRVDIINYSGGGPEPSTAELQILKEAERKGILIVAAAGNESSDIDRKDKAFYPASYGLGNIVTVTAYDQKLSLLKSSNWGKSSVDLAAPGHRIRSSIPHKRAGHMTGTSQATAFVSGVAAMIKAQYPQLMAQDIKIILRRSTKKVEGLKQKCTTGGKLDAAKALIVAKEYSKNRRSLAVALPAPSAWAFQTW